MSNNISINGSGKVSGGTYDSVNINGSGCINGDLTCQTMTINGSGSVQGSLTTNGSFTINGSGSVHGDINGRGHISINGSGKVTGSVHCQVFRSAGSGQVYGDCEAEEITMEGGGRVEKLLNGENIRLVLYPQCHMHIGSIGGTNITVEHKPSQHNRSRTFHFFGILSGRDDNSGLRPCGTLETDTIEGDTITLTCTKAARVSGRIVKIGPGCRIGRVEYTETYEADEDATVDELVQL